jgi:hypothetical protein
MFHPCDPDKGNRTYWISANIHEIKKKEKRKKKIHGNPREDSLACVINN